MHASHLLVSERAEMGAIDHSLGYQGGHRGHGCYCVEPHSSPQEIVVAFARCKHPKSEQLQIDADGVATGYIDGTRGLVTCCNCGAHRRSSDGKWVYPHLVACASTAGSRVKKLMPTSRKKTK